MEQLNIYLETRPGNTELIVLLHGLGNRSDRLKDAREVLRTHCPQADLFAPRLPIAHRMSHVPAEKIVADILTYIDSLCAARGEGDAYQAITLVGHSMGAVLARKVSIIAHGEQKDASGFVPAPFESGLASFKQARSWADAVRRIVLIAGMNRGWSPSSGLSWFGSAMLSAGQFLGELAGGKATIFAIRRGAPFLVQTRLQWLALMNPRYGARPDVVLVQLLGSIDDQVAPDDSVDFAIDGVHNTAQRSTYNYIEVRQSGHNNIVCMSEQGDAADATARAERRKKFLYAVSCPSDQLHQHRIERRFMDDSLPPPPDSDVDNMVFVMHGIRDKGFWTKKIARTIKAHAHPDCIESWTESYGYFPMLPFLLHWGRQRKVEWLMDRYCEARARYPDAVFHFVGHSNGTYLAAKALQDYPAARFSRVVFAGSVVRRDYDWAHLIHNTRQVDSVLNYVATADWVVAIFPKGLQWLKSFNLGSAGHDGFADTAVSNVRFIEGSHGAGHQEAVWDEIARFIVHGHKPPAVLPHTTQARKWKMAGAISGLILLTIVALLIAGLATLLYFLFWAETLILIVAWTLGAVGYLALVRLIVTRI